MSDYEDMERPGVTRKRRTREYILTTIIVLALVLLVISVITLVILWWPEKSDTNSGRYAEAAVATDSPECSKVGKEILLKKGSAVDAAIASIFCVGIRNLQGCGIGGGSFLIIYDSLKDGGDKEVRTYDFREVAPLAASKYMFSNGSSSVAGGLAIALPGEVKGLFEVWKQHGRLEWRDLVTPSIQISRDGFNMGFALAKQAKEKEKFIRNSQGLSEILLNKDGSLKQEGDTIRLPKLASTLERIASNPEEFYSGAMAKDIVDDIAEAGGIITLQDLANYKVLAKPPHFSKLPNSNVTLYTMRAPSSGPILTFMLNLLDGFKFTKDDLDGVSKSGLVYHRMVEAFKFGYSMKTYFGDEDFTDLSEILANMSSPAFVDWVRTRISTNQTHPIEYYNPQPGETNIADGGTCHLGVLAPDGGVVSATSTINLGFGSGVVGRRTGILFNNEMDDFTIPRNNPPGQSSYGKGNFIEPGKRPLSSMAPSLLFDGQGKFWVSIGASGGTKITTAILYTLSHYMWLGFSLSDTVEKARLHNQLIPDEVKFEKTFDKEIIETLKNRGHKMIEILPEDVKAVVQAIASECKSKGSHKESSREKCIIAVSDSRKGGKPDGF